MSRARTEILSHRGKWSAASRAHPALRFLEQYTNMVRDCDLGSHGPSSRWYAPSAVFYNGDGVVYQGGEHIWTWMHDLFGPFERLGAQIEESRARVLEGVVTLKPGVGVLAEDGDEPGQDGEGVSDPSIKKGDLVIYEHVIVFYPRDEALRGEGIPVRRMMEFVVGEPEEAGQGTSERQFWRGKVWWDTVVLARELAERRRKAAGMSRVRRGVSKL
ncbi:hypothetical protein BC834DRAFT_904921 [Gloeopeniophorella convolvens]|nr:hypothetical protein BC834DRAFT_904921 [Gloeopeniophorella convolvens]